MYLQYVNRSRRCSPQHLPLASSHGEVAPMYASGYLPALASKERSHAFVILIPAGSSESYF